MSNEKALKEAIRACSLHTSLMLVSKVLTRTGYGDITILDRRQPKQRSRLGGCELLCQTSIGAVSLKVIIKVIKDSIRVRMLDELAGAIDRTKADFGIIVSTEDLSSKVLATKDEYRKSRVEVIDLDLLCQMLSKFRIAVRPNGEPDYAFLAELEDQMDRVSEFLAYERFTR